MGFKFQSSPPPPHTHTHGEVTWKQVVKILVNCYTTSGCGRSAYHGHFDQWCPSPNPNKLCLLDHNNDIYEHVEFKKKPIDPS
jgi:hypothetical protein